MTQGGTDYGQPGIRFEIDFSGDTDYSPAGQTVEVSFFDPTFETSSIGLGFVDSGNSVFGSGSTVLDTIISVGLIGEIEPVFGSGTNKIVGFVGGGSGIRGNAQNRIGFSSSNIITTISAGVGITGKAEVQIVIPPRIPLFPEIPNATQYKVVFWLDGVDGLFELKSEETEYQPFRNLFIENSGSDLTLDQSQRFEQFEFASSFFESSNLKAEYDLREYDASELRIEINISEKDIRGMNPIVAKKFIQRNVNTIIRNCLSLPTVQ